MNCPEPNEVRVVGGLPGGVKMSQEELLPISFKVEVKVNRKEDNLVSVTVPAELRLTQNLLNYISKVLAERELTLVHMDINAEHKKELENIPNVVVQDQEK